ncbi:tetratricopeptide repeat protein [Candidatus Nomurabacteria bacterium]|nr:tetratricopeptide repeat protein [Candidatus Nomurabacteria bacterium]
MLNIFLILIILLSLAYLAWLLYQKLPHLSNINVESLPHIQNKQKKDDILKTRLKRDLGKVFSFWRHVSLPARDRVFDWFKNNYGKLKELERDLRRRSQEQFSSTLSKSQTVDELLTEAKILFNNEEYSKAEEVLIDALSVDPYSVDVYKLLANVYREKKEYEQAKETLKYLLKLTHNADAGVFTSLAEISKVRGNLKQAEEEYLQSISLSDDNHLNFLSLAEVYLDLDDQEQALETAQRALLLSPNNPKILDFLINISIIIQDKELANRYLAKLQEVNPDNQKIAHFIEEIDELV